MGLAKVRPAQVALNLLQDCSCDRDSTRMHSMRAENRRLRGKLEYRGCQPSCRITVHLVGLCNSSGDCQQPNNQKLTSRQKILAQNNFYY